jgi:CBS domain-containing protein
MPPKQSIAEVQIHMMKKRIHHVCITEDGSTATPLVGVISQHDLLLAQGNNPAVLIKAIQRSHEVATLRSIREKAEHLLGQYLEREVSIDFIATMMTEVNDALIAKTIELAIAELEEEGTPLPEIDWCWMGLGSEGRGEQLLRTDQDNALVFSDIPSAELESTRERFLLLATKVTKQLNACGFEYCPADMMASNPRWCLSLNEWKEQFSRWILTPTNQNILHCNIFFDFRALYGATPLTAALTQHIFELIDQQNLFLPLLAKNALQNPPPLSFFRNFVVEKDGQHKDAFNIKARAMMPLTDAARLLTLGNKISKINNTFERFEKLAEVEPKYKELFQQAADAYESLMRYRAIQGLKNQDSGKFFKPEDLSKMERLNLRNCFRPIQELQDIIKVRYQLNYFG